MVGQTRRFEREVTVGMVGINVPIPVPVAFYSFGGWKASIFGDSPIYGPEGIHFRTRPKIVITLARPIRECDRPWISDDSLAQGGRVGPQFCCPRSPGEERQHASEPTRRCWEAPTAVIRLSPYPWEDRAPALR